MTDKHIGHLFLKEIVAESVHIDYRQPIGRLGNLAYDGAAHRSAVIIGVRHICHLITVAKHVGHPDVRRQGVNISLLHHTSKQSVRVFCSTGI